MVNTSPQPNRLRFFPQLNQLSDQRWLRSNAKLCQRIAAVHFGSDSLQDTLMRAIADQRILSIKEIMETFEFFARARKTTKAACVADLCCGHGLLGLLFAVFERKVEQVVLLDKFEPESRAKLIAVVASVAPWVTDKVKSHESKLDDAQDLLPENCSIVSAHACGVLSDQCIDIAIKIEGRLAILPCCYPKASCDAPNAIQTAFGLNAAYDIDRTYRLTSAGYLVQVDGNSGSNHADEPDFDRAEAKLRLSKSEIEQTLMDYANHPEHL